MVAALIVPVPARRKLVAVVAVAGAVSGRLLLDPLRVRGVQPEQLNIPDERPAALDGLGDLYHHAIRRLVSGGADELIDEWVFDVRPPTDDRPFFADFCRLGALGATYEDTAEHALPCHPPLQDDMALPW